MCVCAILFFFRDRGLLGIQNMALLKHIYHAVLNDGEGYELDWTDGDTRYRYVVSFCDCMLLLL